MPSPPQTSGPTRFSASPVAGYVMNDTPFTPLDPNRDFMCPLSSSSGASPPTRASVVECPISTTHPASPSLPLYWRSRPGFGGADRTRFCDTPNTPGANLHATHLPDGFRVGYMSDAQFCDWVLSATTSPSVRNARVLDVGWWRSCSSALHETLCVSVIFSHKGTSTIYDLLVQQPARGSRKTDDARNGALVLITQSLNTFCAKNDLVLALVGSAEVEQKPPARSAWATSLIKDFKDDPTGSAASFSRAFSTELDKKWRGPPSTLGHVARYMQHISHSSLPCFRTRFARLLLNAIVLRHYTFSHVAMPRESPVQEEKSITSAIFALFAAQDSSENLVGPHHQTLGVLINLILLMGMVTLWIAVVTDDNMIFRVTMPCSILVLVLARIFGSAIAADRAERLEGTAKAQVSKLIQDLDEDVTLTHPLARRGPYVPYDDPSEGPEAGKSFIWPRLAQRNEYLPRWYDGNPVRLR